MTAEIKVPNLGESVTEATVAKWLKRPGEAVAIDEPIAELETDKITLEVYAPAAGTLAEILADEGANLAVGAVLGRIAEGAAARPSPAPHPGPLPASGAREKSAESPSPRDSGERQGPAKREGEGQTALQRSGPAVRKLI
ncbi:MAG: dihydrolipoamide succinyltransferase, partial [Alphaproteobacteria bacterium]